jgi:hypothetical protein
MQPRRLAERLDQRLQCRLMVRRERRLIYPMMEPKIDNVRPVLEEPRPPSYPSFEGCRCPSGSVPILIGAFWRRSDPDNEEV